MQESSKTILIYTWYVSLSTARNSQIYNESNIGELSFRTLTYNKKEAETDIIY